MEIPISVPPTNTMFFFFFFSFEVTGYIISHFLLEERATTANECDPFEYMLFDEFIAKWLPLCLVNRCDYCTSRLIKYLRLIEKQTARKHFVKHTWALCVTNIEKCSLFGFFFSFYFFLVQSRLKMGFATRDANPSTICFATFSAHFSPSISQFAINGMERYVLREMYRKALIQ